jgi:hypothetical protein
MEQISPAVKDSLTEAQNAFLELIMSLPERKRDHMKMLFSTLAKCYVDPDMRAVVIVDNDTSPQGIVIGVNVDEMLTTQIISDAYEVMVEVNQSDAPDKEMMN